MSLFKKRLLVDYSPVHNDGLKIYLQTALFEKVKAPFGGKAEVECNGIILTNGDIKMVVSNITPEDIKEVVKEGQQIGTTMAGKLDGRNVHYIGVEIFKNNVAQNVIPYLFNMDSEEVKVRETKEVGVINEPVSSKTQTERPSSETVRTEAQQKQTVKKSTNTTKKTK